MPNNNTQRKAPDARTSGASNNMNIAIHAVDNTTADKVVQMATELEDAFTVRTGIPSGELVNVIDCGFARSISLLSTLTEVDMDQHLSNVLWMLQGHLEQTRQVFNQLSKQHMH